MPGAKFVENGQPGRKFFAWVCGGWDVHPGCVDSSGPRGIRSDHWVAVPQGAFFCIECTKKRPKAFFNGCFLDVITVTALPGRPVGAGFKTVEAGSKTAGGKAFYAKK